MFTNEIGSTNNDHGVYPVKPSLVYRVRRKLNTTRKEHIFEWGNAIAATVNSVHKSNRIDVLEMEESFGWCDAVQRSVAFPVVVKLHGPAFLTQIDNPDQNLVKTRINAEGQALRRMSAIISPSQNALELTRCRYDLMPKIAAVIPNPMNTDDGWPIWKLEACEKNTILFVGRFEKIKGADTALFAFRKLLDARPRLRLIFVGPDTGLTFENLGRVHFDTFAASLFSPEQRKQISYLGGLPRSRIFALRTQAFATIVASRWESQSYTALEAMVQGCPLVASDAGGLGEIIEDGGNGLLSRIGDIDDLCSKVMLLIENPRKASELGANARCTVLERYSPERLTIETVAAYAAAKSLLRV